MKSLRLISILMVVACTLLCSCTLLEPSPLFSSSEFEYDEFDEINESGSDIEYAYQEDSHCYVCSCPHYQPDPHYLRNCKGCNPVCLCGHSWKLHLSRMEMPSFPEEWPRFEVFVPYQNVIATYKEAVDAAPITGNPDAFQKTEVFINPLYIPAEGGSYEFEYVNETFYISSVYDSSMQPVDSSVSTRLFKSVKSLSYEGPYYKISCNRGVHTWKIEVDPMPISDEPEMRSIYVLMWTSSHNYNFVFQFNQSNFE